MPELIDRAKVLKYLTPRIKTETTYGEGYNKALEDSAALVALMPTISPEVRRGRWIDNESRCYPYKCTSCNTSADWHYKFCPYCGSKNEGD